MKYSGSNTGTGSSSKSHYGSLFNCFLLTVKTLLLAKKLRVNPRLRLRPRNRKTPLPYLQTNDPPETIFRMLLHAKFLCLLRLFFLLSLSLPLFFIENSFSYFFFLQHFFSCFLDIHTRLLSPFLSLFLSTGFNTTQFFWRLFTSKKTFSSPFFFC